MTEIRALAITLCAVSLGCAVLQLLAPKGGFGRLFSMVTAAFFLCSLLSPLSSLAAGELSPAPSETVPLSEEELQQRFYQQLKEQTEAVLSERATQLLASHGIAVAALELDMHISSQGDIYMRRIILYLDKQNIGKATTARAVLQQQLGIAVSVRESP